MTSSGLHRKEDDNLSLLLKKHLYLMKSSVKMKLSGLSLEMESISPISNGPKSPSPFST